MENIQARSVRIFDSHCHYNDEKYNDDRDSLLIEIQEKGVIGLLHASSDLKSSRFGVEYSQKYPFMYASVGIHPLDVQNTPDDYIDELKGMTKSAKVVAIGEIGLDYFYEGYDKELQKRIFEEQLILANQLNLPCIIHSRDATEDTMRLLKKHNPRGVVHCFSGSAQTARELQSLGLYISFTGVLTFKNARRSCEALLAVQDDRLLLETDCPYMAPEPFRGKRCDSSMIYYTAKRISELKNIPIEMVLEKTIQNTYQLFNRIPQTAIAN